MLAAITALVDVPVPTTFPEKIDPSSRQMIAGIEPTPAGDDVVYVVGRGWHAELGIPAPA